MMQSRSELVSFVDESRLWARHVQMAGIGSTPGGGVERLALTADDVRARRALYEWSCASGFSVTIDDIGNIFVRRDGTESDLAPVLAGSHLDSQPKGGRYDGTYGVLAALEALMALEEAGVKTRRAIEVVSWTNEEGARFQPGLMGSAVFAGSLSLQDALSITDRDGSSVQNALSLMESELAHIAKRKTPFPVAAYVEAHIEQGPRLEQGSKTIGVVKGIQGARWFQVKIEGEPGHAGTVPMDKRKDAFVTAVEIVSALQNEVRSDSQVRFTVGQFDVLPGSPNTIPGHVDFSIDLRHPDVQYLDNVRDRIVSICQDYQGSCTVEVIDTMQVEPVFFNDQVIDLVAASTRSLDLPYLEMFSGALHDAKHLADICPAGMIFIPCEGGRSHNESESAEPSDLAAGCRVLTLVLEKLANT